MAPRAHRRRAHSAGRRGRSQHCRHPAAGTKWIHSMPLLRRDRRMAARPCSRPGRSSTSTLVRILPMPPFQHRRQKKKLPRLSGRQSSAVPSTNWLLPMLRLRPRMVCRRPPPMAGVLATHRPLPPSRRHWRAGCERRRTCMARRNTRYAGNLGICCWGLRLLRCGGRSAAAAAKALLGRGRGGRRHKRTTAAARRRRSRERFSSGRAVARI